MSALLLLFLAIFAWLFSSGEPQQRSDMVVSRHAAAPAGERSKIGFIPFVYPNCDDYGEVTFGVYQKPQHGELPDRGRRGFAC